MSNDWEHARVGSWLVTLAVSCAVHGVLVWQGLTFAWPERPWVEAVVPVEVVHPIPETPPPAVSRPVPRQPSPPRAEANPPPPMPPASRMQTEAPVPDVSPATVAPAAPTMAIPVTPSPTTSQETGPLGTARLEAAGSSQTRTEPTPAPSVVSLTPLAPEHRITQPARPRGGYQVRPAYPAAARRAGAEGTTILRAHIRMDGTIDQVQVSRSAGHAVLDEAAAAAVSRWRFEPARNGAEPVAVWVLIPVEFRLQ